MLLSSNLVGLPVFAWTILVFVVIWLFSMLGLLVFWASHTYVLRQDGIEIRRGIIRLHSFVVTPMGFGDLLVYQSVGGRIFGYGDITVNSQGERQTKLVLVRSPFAVADTIRDIMGKPLFAWRLTLRTGLFYFAGFYDCCNLYCIILVLLTFD